MALYEFGNFFADELQDYKMYLDVVSFVKSPHIRCGEFECNSHVIGKIDHNYLEIWLEECPEDYLSRRDHSYKIDSKIFLHFIEEEATKRKLIPKNHDLDAQ